MDDKSFAFVQEFCVAKLIGFAEGNAAGIAEETKLRDKSRGRAFVQLT